MDRRVVLGEKEIPDAWFNLAAWLPEPVPPLLNPTTRRPLKRRELEPLLTWAVVEQEWSLDPWIEIPGEVRSALAAWRPTPLVRARGLEEALGTPARIYFKDESLSPPGSHKANTAAAQAYYAKQEGVDCLVTETGAGQWGCSLALCCSTFGLGCRVFMVRLSHRQRPYRRSMMELWGAEVRPSPSRSTDAGRRLLAADPHHPGNIGIAISEAIETASRSPGSKYAMGSVLGHVLLHQTVIGLETQRQLALAGERPDVLVGCTGGGSNFAGLVFPYVPEKLDGGDLRFLAAEPAGCASLSRGEYRYDSADSSGLTPLVKMCTLDHRFAPSAIRACGLRYHGMSPLVSLLHRERLIEAAAYEEQECFEAARLFARTEGLVPAVESSYAIRAAAEEAVRCREEGEEQCIVFVLSGHGLCELPAYDDFLSGRLASPAVEPALHGAAEVAPSRG